MRDDYTLHVLWDGDTVGYLTPAAFGAVDFRYAESWVASGKRPVSLSLPVAQKKQETAASTAFFENLLPEDEPYRELCAQARLDQRDIYGFLERYGKECAGALMILPAWEVGEEPAGSAYRQVTQDLERLLSQSPPSAEVSLISSTGSRLSVAGAQNKLPVLWRDGQFFVPDARSLAPTNAILKPASLRFADLPRNEAFCMELARAAGLNVPDFALVPLGSALVYVARRYDRAEGKTGIVRLHQEDFCQALGVRRFAKYEEQGGPGFAACGKLLLRPEIIRSVQARENLIRCALFNYLIGNGDSHAKNFSLLYEKDGIGLAPFYDLVSTTVYDSVSKRMAMSIGGTALYKEIDRASWKRLAKDMFVHEKLLFSLMDTLREKVDSSVVSIFERQNKAYGYSPIATAIYRAVRQGLKKFEEWLP